MKPFITFILAAVAWAMVGAASLNLDIAHPVAVGVVWLVGFVWLTGYIAASTEDADALTQIWLWSMASIAALALVGVAIIG